MYVKKTPATTASRTMETAKVAIMRTTILAPLFTNGFRTRR